MARTYIMKVREIIDNKKGLRRKSYFIFYRKLKRKGWSTKKCQYKRRKKREKTKSLLCSGDKEMAWEGLRDENITKLQRHFHWLRTDR